MVLSRLPRNYDTLLTALEARPKIDVTLSNVLPKLVDEYQRVVKKYMMTMIYMDNTVYNKWIEPNNLKEALSSESKSQWVHAMEYQRIELVLIVNAFTE